MSQREWRVARPELHGYLSTTFLVRGKIERRGVRLPLLVLRGPALQGQLRQFPSGKAQTLYHSKVERID